MGRLFFLACSPRRDGIECHDEKEIALGTDVGRFRAHSRRDLGTPFSLGGRGPGQGFLGRGKGDVGRFGGGAEEEGMKPVEERRFTGPQIRYWLISLGLVVGGAAAAIWGDELPWQWLRLIAKELGPGIFTAGIIASLVEPFFRREFARDAFLAAFRYVLPPAFKEEVEKILRFESIADKQVWTVRVEKASDETVLVTTTFERIIKNKTKSNKSANAWYEAEDYKFPEGSTKIIECAIQEGSQVHRSSTQTDREHDVEAKSAELTIRPDGSAKVWGKATQYRRTNDAIYETFRVPIVNPEIKVVIDDNEFSHTAEFGTYGNRTKSKYENHYTLSGVYFPGQFMVVRWWPKKMATESQA
jgi:hypothetical protein